MARHDRRRGERRCRFSFGHAAVEHRCDGERPMTSEGRPPPEKEEAADQVSGPGQRQIISRIDNQQDNTVESATEALSIESIKSLDDLVNWGCHNCIPVLGLVPDEVEPLLASGAPAWVAVGWEGYPAEGVLRALPKA